MPADDTIELRTADQILAMLDNGDFLHDFLTRHADLIVAMHNHQMTHGGKAKGKVTLTLAYTLDKQLSLQIEGDAKFEKPKAPKASATLWTTAEGALTPQNPRQPNLPGIRRDTRRAAPARLTPSHRATRPKEAGMADQQNLPILYRNCLDGMPSDLAKDAWLWATERSGMDRMLYAADRFAMEVHKCVERLTPMMEEAARLHGRAGHDPDLMRFILTRHANWRFGGNLKPSYCVGDSNHG
jgi:hypothetical protein